MKERCDFHFLHSKEQKGKKVTKFSEASKYSFNLLHSACFKSLARVMNLSQLTLELTSCLLAYIS